MANFYCKQVSALEKIFLDDKPEDKAEFNSFSALQGEKFSYQIMYRDDTHNPMAAQVTVESTLKEHIALHIVGNVPAEVPRDLTKIDDDYITTKADLFPDVLYPLEDGKILIDQRWHSLWIDVNIPKYFESGTYPIAVTIRCEETTQTLTFNLKVIGAVMPEQKTIYTQWFHTDCISNYFGVDVFSDAYWKIVENYLKAAVESGVNMILTPVFTPPLDTAVGSERKTVQLVDVYLDDGKYTFNFDKFVRWVKLSQRCGIRYFEISHLFTQWGAEFTPKIMAVVDGESKRIFGWDVRATSDEYRQFLDSFIPELTAKIDELGIRENTYFHVSDEPNEEQLDSYLAAKEVLRSVLKGFKIMDALSHYEFYEKGIVELPVPITSSVEEFYQHNVKGLWTYTCCIPSTIYSNRFITMPSGRNRVIGMQMYKYDIVGFLHWGMNFYNTQYSLAQINPYQVTDAGGAFPSGDAFTLYPYKDGAIGSIHGRVFFDALQDMRTMTLLESYIGKEKVVELIESFGIMTFADYSHDYSKLLALKAEANALIEKYVAQKIGENSLS